MSFELNWSWVQMRQLHSKIYNNGLAAELPAGYFYCKCIVILQLLYNLPNDIGAFFQFTKCLNIM